MLENLVIACVHRLVRHEKQWAYLSLYDMLSCLYSAQGCQLPLPCHPKSCWQDALEKACVSLEWLHGVRFVAFLPHQMGHLVGKMLGEGSEHASEMKEAFSGCVACLVEIFSECLFYNTVVYYCAINSVLHWET